MDPKEIRDGELDFSVKALSGDGTQAVWLNDHLKKKVNVVVFKGQDIEGDLMGFDAETLVLKRATGTQDSVLVFKSAVQCVEEAIADQVVVG